MKILKFLLELWSFRLTLLFPMFPFDSPWKRQKTKGFLTFWGGLKENIVKKGLRLQVGI